MFFNNFFSEWCPINGTYGSKTKKFGFAAINTIFFVIGRCPILPWHRLTSDSILIFLEKSMFALPGVRSDTFWFFKKFGRSPESLGTKKQYKKSVYCTNHWCFTYCTVQFFIFWPENMLWSIILIP